MDHLSEQGGERALERWPRDVGSLVDSSMSNACRSSPSSALSGRKRSIASEG
jgi:hypothetical protein